MLILLEGVDCAGKTTLAGRLASRLRAVDPTVPVRYHHRGVPDDHPLVEYVEPLLMYRPDVGQHVVCDRWHVGESVYPTLVDRPTAQTESVRAYVELFLRSRGALLVHCDVDDERAVACGVARGDDETDLARVPRAAREFRRYVAGRTLLPTLSVDVSDPDRSDYDDLVDEVLGYAAREASAASRLGDVVTYVGPTRPSLLLVGDRRGTPRHTLSEFGLWPAFAPFPSTSGSYLIDTLTLEELRVPTHGVQLRDVGLINACDVDDVRAAWELLGRPRVVALGNNAQRALARLEVPYRAAFHPQHQRRFFHHQRRTYLSSLLTVPLLEVSA